MNKLLAPLVLFAAISTAYPIAATAAEPATVAQLTAMAKRFAPAELKADTSKLSKGDRAAMAKLDRKSVV